MQQQKRNLQGMIYSGTSGLQTPIPKRDFPPDMSDKSRLGYYATLFNSIEINSSFYKLPVAKTLVRWATEVPENFRFTFKLWQNITHNKQLTFSWDDVGSFMERINAVGTKKGALLVQFPPSLSNVAIPQLSALLSAIRQFDTEHLWPIAVEFRHRSWYGDETLELLEKHQTAIVLHDMPASATPISLSAEGNNIYLRFHGPEGRYKDSYSDEILYEYAMYVKEWHNDGKNIFVYFNNTAGNAIGNLLLFNSFLK